MRRITGGMFLTCLLIGCAIGPWVPRTRDVTERPISGDYWYQQFTLYDPASFSTDCQISRTGRRIDLNSPAEVAEAWRQFCKTTTDHDSPSSNN